MNADNKDEVVATGDLFKQSSSGSKTWALRKFSLVNIYMVYYDKEGNKKGQWDITDCFVKSMSPEEVGTGAAKNAFALVGPKKTHILCASSDKNRIAWCNLIREQIEEYKDLLRRFLKTGEQIVGSGAVKRKNMFGMSNQLRMVLTNMPRILLIDEASSVVNDQMSWPRDEPPTLTKISDTKFKINLDKKEYNLEDVGNGTKYWEDIFKRFPTMTYYVPKRRMSMLVDFNDDGNNDYFKERERLSIIDGKAGAPKRRMSVGNAEESANNLKFLQNALSNIDQLVEALGSKIDEIDTMNSMSGVDDFNDAVVEERKAKRVQLQLLKDNVSVLASNLKTLVARSMETGTTNFDIDAIESVVTETSAMLLMLSQDVESSPPEQQPVDEETEFAETMEKMDKYAADMENELDAIDEMIANVEFHDINADEMIEEIGATFESIHVKEEVAISSSNFDAFDPNKRPSNWKDVRLKRILVKEFVFRLEGVPEKMITENHKAMMAEEEEIMISEVVNFGRLLNMETLNKPSVLQAAIAVTDDNFLASDPSKRPAAWQAVRLKRAILKEDQARYSGTDESTIMVGRTNRVLQEEKVMLHEVATYGQVLSLGGYDYSAVQPGDLDLSNSAFDPSSDLRPKGWTEIRTKRVLVKELLSRLNNEDDDRIMNFRPKRERQEEALMLQEIKETGSLNDFTMEENTAELFSKNAFVGVNENTFDPSNYYKRPTGWVELRKKRVLVRELVDRLAGISDETIALMRSDKERLEEEIMMDEAIEQLFAVKRVPLIINANNFDRNDDRVRPPGWAELREKRVEAIEYIERLQGKSMEAVLTDHENKVAAEEALMVKEAVSYGGVLLVDSVKFKSKKATNFLSSKFELHSKSGLFEFGLRKGAVNASTFATSKKPLGWNEIRNKRLQFREQLALLLGQSEQQIEATRDQRKVIEDAIMLKEAEIFQNVLTHTDGPVQIGDLPIDAKSFSSGATRPAGWAATKEKRVRARLRTDRDNGIAKDVTDKNRSKYAAEEEEAMKQEVQALGNVLIVGEGADFEITEEKFVANLPNIRPTFWADVKAKRMATRNSSDADEEQIMLAEMEAFDNVLIVSHPLEFVVTPQNFDHKSSSKRPLGWTDVKARRVLAQEKFDRHDEEKTKSLRSQRLQEEERAMQLEVETYGNVLVVERNTELNINEDSYNPKDLSKRPHGWSDVKYVRIQARQQIEIQNGADERTIMESKAQYNKKEEESMIAEVAKYGFVLPLGGHKRTPRPAGVLIVTKKTLGSKDSVCRPVGWSKLRSDRLQAREFVDRAVGVSETTVLEARSKRDVDEENLMFDEVTRYGGPLIFVSFGNDLDKFKGMRQVIFTDKNFNPEDGSKRPNGWAQTKFKRIVARENNGSQEGGANRRSSGVRRDSMQQVNKRNKNRPLLEKDEEAKMLKNYIDYRAVLGFTSVTQGDLVINNKTFDAQSANKRPEGWNRLRLQRVQLRENVDFANNKSVNEILAQREECLADEEKRMLEEVHLYGDVMNIVGTISAIDLLLNERNFDSSDPSKRPDGWVDLRLKRVMLKESLQVSKGRPIAAVLSERKSLLEEEEEIMLKEVQTYETVLNVDDVNARLGEAKLDPKNIADRSNHWSEIRHQRVVAKEKVCADNDPDSIPSRAQLEQEEDSLMLRELVDYSHVLSVPTMLTEDGGLEVTSLNITHETFDPSNPKIRPPGWEQLKIKRVKVLEQTDRIAGITEAVIQQKYAQRLEDEEDVMIEEVLKWAFANGVKAGRRPEGVNLTRRASNADRNTMRQSQGERQTMRQSRGEKAAATVNNEIIIDFKNFDPKDKENRPEGWVQLRMRRVIKKEQADRLKGVDEETIMDKRRAREEEEDAIMVEEVLIHGTLLNLDRAPPPPKIVVEVSKANYDAGDPDKRPTGWSELRLKRIMLKEHIDRIQGVAEDHIMDMRAEREVVEEIAMIDEVTTLKRVLAVGETRPKTEKQEEPVILITPINFDPANPHNRPKGWRETLKARVMIKEKYDRLNGVSAQDIQTNHTRKEEDEEDIMIEEAKSSKKISLLVAGTQMKVKNTNNPDRDSIVITGRIDINPGNFDPSDPTKRPPGWNTIRKKRVAKKEQLDRLRGVKEADIIAKREQRIAEEEALMLKEVKEHGALIGLGGIKPNQAKNQFENLQNVEDIDVTDENFDPNDPTKRPKGWATVKLRRVYIKEWMDRKEGLDEEEILQKRFQREQEAEQEMIQEMSVLGRIRKFERMAQKNKNKALVPSKVDHLKGTTTKSNNLSNFISAANKTLENLSGRVADTLTEKVTASGGPPGGNVKVSGVAKKTTPAPAPPRIIDTGRGPRPLRPTSSRPVNNAFPSKSADAAFKDIKLRKVFQSVNDLDLSPEKFYPSDPNIRPEGWAEIRQRRVEELEAKDRSHGHDESYLHGLRPQRLAEEEERMLEEANVVLRVSHVESSGVGSKTFYANYADEKNKHTSNNLGIFRR